MKKLYVELDLRMFGEGGGGAAGGDGGAASAEGGTDVSAGTAPEAGAPAVEGAEAPPEKTPEMRRAEYDKLISEYRDIYDAERKNAIEKAVNDRFKGVNKKMQAYEKFVPLMETFAGRYGVDPANTDALIEAISNDNALYEDEAMQRGMSVDQLKAFKRMEAEVNMHRRARAEQQRREELRQTFAAWDQQAETAKQFYPGFDLRKELNDPQTGERFRALLGSRVDVKTAYEVIHQQEIISGVASRVAEDTSAKVRNDIAARGRRPAEAGAAGTPGIKTEKINPANLTNKELDEISRRVLRGERVTF